MKNLIKDKVYFDELEKDIPLKYLGYFKEFNVGMGDYIKLYYFKPVKTEKNKNWYNSTGNTVTRSEFSVNSYLI